MTAIQRVKSSPIAPYMGLVRGMSREDKLALVTFITETLDEPEPQRQVPEEFKKSRVMAVRSGWAEAARHAHAAGQDRLMADDVFADETLEDLTW